jgi:hypothetical protein
MATAGIKRKSRFEDDDSEVPQQKRLSLDISVAAAKAVEISRDLSSKVLNSN